MAAALLVVYVALSFLNDTHGFLGTDTGGKVATLEMMSAHHEGRPDVGYWAAEWDPNGDLHPLFDTTLIKGRWIQVSTLPVLYAAVPLFNLFGYRGVLVLPMLGSVAAALAARALARRLGSQRPWVLRSGSSGWPRPSRCTRSTSGSTRSGSRSCCGPASRCSTSSTAVAASGVDADLRLSVRRSFFGPSIGVQSDRSGDRAGVALSAEASACGSGSLKRSSSVQPGRSRWTPRCPRSSSRPSGGLAVRPGAAAAGDRRGARERCPGRVCPMPLRPPSTCALPSTSAAMRRDWRSWR